MTTTQQPAFKLYRRLRDEVSHNCSQLHQLHLEHTQCRKGCSSCCMDFSLLPVEFHYILHHIKSGPITINNEAIEGQCIFLVNNACTIYEHRPIICRSHGLPILFMDEEGENFNLSFCPLNFNDVDDDYFSLENSYHQDTINSKLYQNNKSFVGNLQGQHYSERQMLEMSRLKDFLL
jgi:uncharacterized protein